MSVGDGSCWARVQLNERVAKRSNEQAPRFNMIAAAILRRAADKLEANQSMETVAGDLLPILEVMARRL